jgi:hypothetical protein
VLPELPVGEPDYPIASDGELGIAVTVRIEGGAIAMKLMTSTSTISRLSGHRKSVYEDAPARTGLPGDGNRDLGRTRIPRKQLPKLRRTVVAEDRTLPHAFTGASR